MTDCDRCCGPAREACRDCEACRDPVLDVGALHLAYAEGDLCDRCADWYVTEAATGAVEVW